MLKHLLKELYDYHMGELIYNFIIFPILMGIVYMTFTAFDMTKTPVNPLFDLFGLIAMGIILFSPLLISFIFINFFKIIKDMINEIKYYRERSRCNFKKKIDDIRTNDGVTVESILNRIKTTCGGL